MMTVLVLDTETAGLPRDHRAPPSDLANWPRLVQVAWALYVGRSCVRAVRRLIRPDGFEIPPAAAAVHGITTGRARAEGIALADALRELADALAGADVIAGHNLAFDERVLTAEYLRSGLPVPFAGQTRIDTMLLSAPLLRLAGRHGYKYPRLGELYFFLFGEEPAQAHAADADVATCARCLFALAERGLLPRGLQQRLIDTTGGRDAGSTAL